MSRTARNRRLAGLSLGLLVGLIGGLAWALPLPDVSAQCPHGEGQIQCALQHAWLAAATKVMICGALGLGLATTILGRVDRAVVRGRLWLQSRLQAMVAEQALAGEPAAHAPHAHAQFSARPPVEPAQPPVERADPRPDPEQQGSPGTDASPPPTRRPPVPSDARRLTRAAGVRRLNPNALNDGWSARARETIRPVGVSVRRRGRGPGHGHPGTDRY